MTYEQSGGQNRISHSTFKDFKKKTSNDDLGEEEERGDKEPAFQGKHSSPSAVSQTKTSSTFQEAATKQKPASPQPHVRDNKEGGGYKYSKHQQKSSPPSSSNRRNSIESQQVQSPHNPERQQQYKKPHNQR